MTRRPVINEKLYEQFENEGRDVSYTYRGEGEKAIKVRARVTDPVEKMFQKGYISNKEVTAADKYMEDIQLSVCENYAQAILNGLPAGTSEFGFEDRRLQAAKRAYKVKINVRSISSHRQRKLKKLLSKIAGSENLTTYEVILNIIFENRYGIVRAERETGINHDAIYEKCKEIAKIIFKCYEKTSENNC